jgi:hypothetical protein
VLTHNTSRLSTLTIRSGTATALMVNLAAGPSSACDATVAPEPRYVVQNQIDVVLLWVNSHRVSLAHSERNNPPTGTTASHDATTTRSGVNGTTGKKRTINQNCISASDVVIDLALAPNARVQPRPCHSLLFPTDLMPGGMAVGWNSLLGLRGLL